MPSLLTYYDSLDRTAKGEFLTRVADECGIGYVTAQQKIGKLRRGHNTFTKLERKEIAVITGIPLQHLFSSDLVIKS